MSQRLLFKTANKILLCLGGSSAAATVVLSDKELNKKPEWYKNSVLILEDSLKKLSKYKPIENQDVLNKAEEILRRVASYNSVEILWRLGRTLFEKSELLSDHHQKIHFLHEAIKFFHKALNTDQNSNCAGLHKWYAIALTKLLEVDKKHKDCANAKELILSHLKQALNIDSKDPFSWHYLGIYHCHNKNYKEAIEAFKKAEESRPNFCAANSYYLGLAYYYSNNKEEAIKYLKKSLTQPTIIDADAQGKIKAKNLLLNKLKQKEQDIDIGFDY